MRCLLDSHILIWQFQDDPRLPASIAQALSDPANDITISVVTFWELTIKESMGKLRIAGGVAGLYRDWIVSQAATLLDVEWSHLKILQDLPWLHRDPFDRLLVAQAQAEGCVLLSHDPQVRQYPGLDFP
jgi:PIN domain nuclease of toxin-antitoxin system